VVPRPRLNLNETWPDVSQAMFFLTFKHENLVLVDSKNKIKTLLKGTIWPL